MHSISMKMAAVAAIAAGLAGCGSSGQYGSSGFISGGGDCKALRGEMNKLVNQGVAAKADAVAGGRRLDAKGQAMLDRYNGLLESYLGQQCQNR